MYVRFGLGEYIMCLVSVLCIFFLGYGFVYIFYLDLSLTKCLTDFQDTNSAPPTDWVSVGEKCEEQDYYYPTYYVMYSVYTPVMVDDVYTALNEAFYAVNGSMISSSVNKGNFFNNKKK